MTLYEGLNADQRAAVEHTGSPLIVLAGPGTGKTRVIVHRLAHLIEQGAEPGSILAMTFTNKSAREMRDRLGGLIGAAAADRVQAGTFHRFGRRVIARFGDTIGLPARQDLIDSAQRRDLIDEALLLAADAGDVALGTVARGGRDAAADRLWAWIGSLRSAGSSPADAAELAARWAELIESNTPGWDNDRLAAERLRQQELREAAAVYAQFAALCHERGLQSFDDQVLQPIQILRESDIARTILRDEIRHVVVDEYQDVNAAQLRLLREIAPPERSPDLCVVGDDDQSIYGFRGSDTRAFAHFAETWTDAVTLTLGTNYRSTPAIIEASQRTIALAGERFDETKTLAAGGGLAGDDRPVEAVHLDDDPHGGEAIAAMIRSDRRECPEKPWSSYAVIGTTHDTLDRVGDALELAGVPVVRSRPGVALDDDGVRDVLAWIRWLVEDDALSAVRLMTRPPFGVEQTVALGLHLSHRRVSARARLDDAQPPEFNAWLRERDELPEAAGSLLDLRDALASSAVGVPAHIAVSAIIERGGMAHAELLPARLRAKRVSSLVEVLRFVRDSASRLAPPGDLRSFWAHYERLDDKEKAFRLSREEDEASESDADDGVRLISAHQSKGLEFDTVFIPRIGPSSGGFGSLSPDESPVLPVELTGERPRDRRDEVRRLFYVAMTRAERRLVLLSKRSKSRSKSTHFLHELIWPGKTPLPGGERDGPMLLRDEADVLVGLGSTDPIAAATSGDGQASVVRRAARVRRQARLRAAEVLDAVDRPGVTEAELDAACVALRASAESLAGLASIEANGEAPVWLDEAAASVVAPIAEDAANEDDDDGSTGWPGLKAPLDLSYSKISSYLWCPACFYLEHELKLREPPTESLMLGNAAHVALERFYRAWTEADNEGGAHPGRDELLAFGRAAYYEQIRGEADRSALERVLAQLGAGYDALHTDNAEIMMIEEAVTFEYAQDDNDAPHRFRAKLDRVDRIGDGLVEGFRIIDYKTGAASKKLLEPATDDLQFGVYAMALAYQLGLPPEELSGEACYWVLGAQRVGTLPLGDIDWSKVRRSIDKAVSGMMAGHFEPRKNCDGRCGLFLPGPGGPLGS